MLKHKEKKTTTVFGMNKNDKNDQKKAGKDEQNEEPKTVEDSVLDDLKADVEEDDEYLNEIGANDADPSADEKEPDTDKKADANADEDKTADEPKAENNSMIQALQEQLAQKEEALVRAKADHANSQRLRREEGEKAKKYGAEKIAKDLIELADVFDKAVEHMPESHDQDSPVTAMAEGLTLMRGMLTDIFEKHGIKKMTIEKGVTAFDPNHHNALSRIDANDELKAGSVADVARDGYTLHDRVLRPADVLVAVAPQKP